MTFEYLAMAGLIVQPSSTGKSSWNAEGNFGFCSIASWDGVKPFTCKQQFPTDTA